MVHGETKITGDENGKDPFKMPKEKGLFKVVASGSPLTTHAIVERIIQNRFVIIYLIINLTPASINNQLTVNHRHNKIAD